MASTDEEWVAYGLRLIDADQKLVVKQFLTELLRGRPDGKVLQDVWESTGPDWGFGDDEVLRGEWCGLALLEVDRDAPRSPRRCLVGALRRTGKLLQRRGLGAIGEGWRCEEREK